MESICGEVNAEDVPPFFEVTVDAAQTTAILVLILVLVISKLRNNKQFERQHGEMQDAIMSLHQISRQLADQKLRFSNHETESAVLRREVFTRMRNAEARLQKLESIETSSSDPSPSSSKQT